MLKILFRADAEHTIGTGDLISLIHLSRVFSDNSWKCFFAVRDYEPALQIIKKREIKNVFLIPKSLSIEDEISIIKKICKEKSIECLFMQITKNSLADYENLGKPAQIKICVNFDGILNPDFDAVINWGIGPDEKLNDAYKGKGMRHIVGFKNVILPDCFDWGKIARRKYNKGVNRILITMGGVDEFNLTKRILESLRVELKDREILIITGAGYRFGTALSNFMKRNFLGFNIKNNVNNLFNDYMWADLAFSAGGLTSSELVATRTPALLIAAYEHQLRRCEYFSENKWAYYVGNHTEVNKEVIRDGARYAIENINIFRDKLRTANFRGGNEKIFKLVNACIQ